MWKMDKKVVFLDVDGTMVNEKGEIPESAQYAVRTAQANGHRMVVCSGRSRFQIYDALLELGFSGIVGGAGAFVEDEGKEFYHAFYRLSIITRKGTRKTAPTIRFPGALSFLPLFPFYCRISTSPCSKSCSVNV